MTKIWRHSASVIFFFAACLCFIGCHREGHITDEPTPECYLPVEKLLAQHRPVEAYTLLNQLEPNLFEVPEERRYHAYALWVQAIDDANESLLPCEMLLAEALAFHQQDDYLRGKLLYYQARLLDEKRFMPPVVDYYLRAGRILQRYPDETHRLFTIHYRMGHYYIKLTEPEKAKEAFCNAYRIDTAKRHRMRVMKRLGDLYRQQGQRDSSLLCLEEGLRYARELRDSNHIALLQNMQLYTRFRFKEEEEEDTLISNRYTYAMLYPGEEDSYYYENLGAIFQYERQQYDSAYHYFRLALQHANGNSEVMLSACKRLADVLKEMGRYKECIYYLEQRNSLSDSVYFFDTHSKSNINRMMYKMISDITVNKEKLRHREQLNLLLFFIVCFVLILVSLYQWILHRKQVLMLKQEASIASLQYEHLSLQERIQKQKEEIDALHHARHTDQARIHQSEEVLSRLEEQQEQLMLNLFGQTHISQSIASIQAYNAKNRENPKVLTEKQQDELLRTVLNLFREPIRQLRETYPRLTDSDILYYYLELMQYNTLTIAACFGKTGTNSIHQRKHRLKERMKPDELPECEQQQ